EWPAEYHRPTPPEALSDPISHGGLDVVAKRNATLEAARKIIADNTPQNTQRARKSALRYFWTWAREAHGLDEEYPVSPDLAIDFIVSHSRGLDPRVEEALVSAGVKKPGTHSVATIGTRLAHLSKAHRAQGLPSPLDSHLVRELLSRLRRERANNGGQKRLKALDRPTLNRLLPKKSESLTDLRDAALLLVGCAAGGRRRSELAALNLEDLEELAGGEFLWTLRKGKNDQEGDGLVVPIKGRAAKALREWIEAARIANGAVFRRLNRWGHVSGRIAPGTVYDVVKKRALAAGLDPRGFGAHSMRAGFMTQGGRDGIPLQELMMLSGHRSIAEARRYHRPGKVLNSKAADLF
ncbi:MAG: site-specific integrase, partial [Acidobacteriota bacterium]